MEKYFGKIGEKKFFYPKRKIMDKILNKYFIQI
jgi:hypothetical protein